MKLNYLVYLLCMPLIFLVSVIGLAIYTIYCLATHWDKVMARAR